MALLYSKSSCNRTASLALLFVSLAALILGAPRILSVSAAAPSPQESTPGHGAEASQTTPGERANEGSPQSSVLNKQKHSVMKENFEKMKHDAGELTDLAKALQEELNKSNENILSVDVVEKADRIEKLAKKIKGTARGF